MANGIVLNLDTTKSEFQNPMIELRQGDGNYQSLDVTVTSNGEPFNLTGWTTTFMGTTAGGFKLVDGAVTVTNALQGTFTYTPTKAWGQDQGEFKNAYFSFVKSDKTASSAAFRVNVLDAVDITAEEAGDYISIVDQIIATLNEDLTTLQSSVDQLKAQNNAIKTTDNTWTGTNIFNKPIVGSVSGSAAKLQTARTINGTPFDGTSDITITGSGALAVGGVYPTLADLIAANPDHDRTYITTDNGNWNYWNGTTWVAGGVYQAAVLADHSINYSAMKINYDPRGDNIVHEGKYISGFDDTNHINLWSYQDDRHDTVEIYYNKSGIIRIKKDTISNFPVGQLMLITDTNGLGLMPNFWPFSNLGKYGVLDYYMEVTDTEVLINLDRIRETFGDNFKVYVTIQKNVDDVIIIENADKNAIRRYK